MKQERETVLTTWKRLDEYPEVGGTKVVGGWNDSGVFHTAEAAFFILTIGPTWERLPKSFRAEYWHDLVPMTEEMHKRHDEIQNEIHGVGTVVYKQEVI